MENRRLKLTCVGCCVCDSASEASRVGTGKDYEYRTSDDTFSALRCNSCGLVYLNPRPDISEIEQIYPSNYHAFDFSERNFGVVHKVRSRLEAGRLLSWCEKLPADARILDVGCGDGFHLNLLKKYGGKDWRLEGVDVDNRAVRMAEKKGLKIHTGTIEELDLPKDSFDLALIIQTVEHVENPFKFLTAVKSVLKPGGKAVIVTDNTDALDFKLFKGGYWGGYHFPRHWNLFNRKSLTKMATKIGFEIAGLKTQISPVNWVYSIHNWLYDRNAPRFLINQFTLKSTVSLSGFTMLDLVLQKLGKGALLRAILVKPKSF